MPKLCRMTAGTLSGSHSRYSYDARIVPESGPPHFPSTHEFHSHQVIIHLIGQVGFEAGPDLSCINFTIFQYGATAFLSHSSGQRPRQVLSRAGDPLSSWHLGMQEAHMLSLQRKHMLTRSGCILVAYQPQIGASTVLTSHHCGNLHYHYSPFVAF